MNIREAKEEIVRTIRAYTARDEQGCYRIPAARQRPVLLIGPPGVGKTAVMEQAARECGTGLVAYTITHHTRQSAVGLPQLAARSFDGREYTVTEYTMSEIIGAVYEYEERTGLREGILFIDEINCVSETLAPAMLQFLQYKTFGNHKVPEGWIIAAAGNPREYNRSVRELDMAALDRVRVMNVEADYAVWRDYAFCQGVHPLVISYLEMHPEHFYQATLTRERQEFVTARGWEDLSVLLLEYERQGLPVDRNFMEGFLRAPKIAADFSSYYQMAGARLGAYRIRELLEDRLSGEERTALTKRLAGLTGDTRCMFVRHLLSAASEKMTACGILKRRCEREKEVLRQLSSYMKEPGSGKAEDFLERRSHALRVRRENNLLKPWEERMELDVDEWLKSALFTPSGIALLEALQTGDLSEARVLSDVGLAEEEEKLQRRKGELEDFLKRMTDFIAETFGEDLELADWLHGIQNHGDYRMLSLEQPGPGLLSERKEQEERLRRMIREMEGLYGISGSGC